MLGLGILSFLLAAALVFFALKPKLSFYLDEGWKFRDRTEPSDTYIAANGVGRILAAIVAVAVGVWAMAQHFSDQREERERQQQTALYAASGERCESEIRPKFNETIVWDTGQVANPQEVQELGRELNVEVEITRSNALSGLESAPPPTDMIWVRDPALPKYHNTILFYAGTPFRFQPNPTAEECEKPRVP